MRALCLLPVILIACGGCVAGAAVRAVGDTAEFAVRGAGEVAEGAYNVTKGAVDLATPDGGPETDAIYSDPYD